MNWKGLEKIRKECQTESDIFKVRLLGNTKRWENFRNICEHIVKQVFFNTPNNMVFTYQTQPVKQL